MGQQKTRPAACHLGRVHRILSLPGCCTTWAVPLGARNAAGAFLLVSAFCAQVRRNAQAVPVVIDRARLRIRSEQTAKVGEMPGSSPAAAPGLGVRGRVSLRNTGRATTQDLTVAVRMQTRPAGGEFQDVAGASQALPVEALVPGATVELPYEALFQPASGGAEYRGLVRATITNHAGHMGEAFGPEAAVAFTLVGIAPTTVPTPAGETPSPTPTATPTEPPAASAPPAGTAIVSATPAITLAATATVASTEAPTPTATPAPTQTPAATATPEVTAVPEETPAPTATPEGAAAPEETAAPTPTPAPTDTPASP